MAPNGPYTAIASVGYRISVVHDFIFYQKCQKIFHFPSMHLVPLDGFIRWVTVCFVMVE